MHISGEISFVILFQIFVFKRLWLAEFSGVTRSGRVWKKVSDSDVERVVKGVVKEGWFSVRNALTWTKMKEKV